MQECAFRIFASPHISKECAQQRKAAGSPFIQRTRSLQRDECPTLLAFPEQTFRTSYQRLDGVVVERSWRFVHRSYQVPLVHVLANHALDAARDVPRARVARRCPASHHASGPNFDEYQRFGINLERQTRCLLKVRLTFKYNVKD